MSVVGLFDVEARLRKLATDAQTSTDYRRAEREYESSIVEFNKKTDEFINWLNMEMPDLANEIGRFISLAKETLEYAGAGITEENPNSRIPVPRSVYEMNDVFRELFGENCIYTPVGARDTTPAMIINDVASCVHRLAEHMSRSEKGYERCIVVRDGKARKLCREWDDFASIAYAEGLYNDMDERYLKGWIVCDRLYLRVGSANLHRTYIDLDRGVVDYYDRDPPVNEVMKSMFERVGLSCRLLPNDEGVECTGVNEGNARKVVAVVALATSMDLRLSSPDAFYDDVVYDRMARALREKYKDVFGQ